MSDHNLNQNKMSYGEEKLLTPANGLTVLIVLIVLLLAAIAAFVLSVISLTVAFTIPALVIVIASSVSYSIIPLFMCGLKVINPNEAAVYVLFGSYYGTISKPGFFWINPFCVMINPTVQSPLISSSSLIQVNPVGVQQPPPIRSKKVSLKATTLDNNKQKVNDREGNPIEIGVIVIWRVVSATKAVFEVDDYKSYISTQSDAAIRQVARQYPYDMSDDGEEQSLRGSSTAIADEMKKELQQRVNISGVEIIEVRIAHLAYAQEIAAAMLQRQQAGAIIAAKQKIVDGAVGMVEMALKKLSEKNIVALDDERKAAMVSNLLVVLCGNKDAQPIVNSGSIY